jgi:hypothetical protein
MIVAYLQTKGAYVLLSEGLYVPYYEKTKRGVFEPSCPCESREQIEMAFNEEVIWID